MNRVAVFVDAGYLFAQGAILLSGRKLGRGAIGLDHDALIHILTVFATRVADASLLRIYWYDGAAAQPSPQQLLLADCPNVKLRLGFLNRVGEQKGVDSLIVTDMIELARNRAMSEAVLFAGDEDVRIGVLVAQQFGVRVHLLGLEPSRGNQSGMLRREADTTHEWTTEDVAAFMRCDVSDESTRSVFPAGHRLSPGTPRGAANTLEMLAREAAESVDVDMIPTLLADYASAGLLPRDIDGRLLAIGRFRMGGELDSGTKKALRGAFLTCCRQRLVDDADPTRA